VAGFLNGENRIENLVAVFHVAFIAIDVLASSN